MNRLRLPPTLLNEPLQPNQVARLIQRDKKLYNLQKGKFEMVTKMTSKQEIAPKNIKFSMKEARTLFKGEYYVDENEQQNEIEALPPTQTTIFGLVEANN